MPQLPFIESLILCIGPQVVDYWAGVSASGPGSSRSQSVCSVLLASRLAQSNQATARSFLPSAGGYHPCGKVRAEHVSVLQPFQCRAETLY